MCIRARPRSEVAYFNYHLLGARLLRQEGGEGAESQEDERLLQVTRRMVREIEKMVGEVLHLAAGQLDVQPLAEAGHHLRGGLELLGSLQVADGGGVHRGALLRPAQTDRQVEDV